MELKISSQSQADYAVVAVRGEIDLYTAPHLHSELVATVDEGAGRLLVDMSRVDFCDSTGMNVLLSAMKRAREKGGDLELVAPKPSVMKILQITGLDAVFTIHASTDALPVTAGTSAAK
ncbi:STAS domain-containing protein [Marinitenerispora sediminis]|uniref:Anti-sigma factor antagonist n=1 Tax=Marinitenerispora sediminis TaxID=1931232 RepID=A0A368T0M7_9ACTN|nr:STAS domain-containing protein [Marinitenerispora sediminis]RCV50957.1 anti-anti-sigma factor [Marinitenerispora sediminis]RCV53128.1 anti-anti-sigma factor [Marinitenerispora sediminis]RCV60420.1 anti-anti-sigma factor [Marinitenerispora sediminis]